MTDHDNKPAFDDVWASWMPDGYGPVRSFVESRMPEGDLILPYGALNKVGRETINGIGQQGHATGYNERQRSASAPM